MSMAKHLIAESGQHRADGNNQNLSILRNKTVHNTLRSRSVSTLLHLRSESSLWFERLNTNPTNEITEVVCTCFKPQYPYCSGLT